MSVWLRQHAYALKVTLRRLTGQPFSALTNLVVMALALALPLLGASVLVSTQPVAQQLSVTPELTLYMSPDARPAQTQATAARISQENARQITGMRIVPRDQALRELRADPTWNEALSVLAENPLPDAIVVTLANNGDIAATAAQLAQTWKQWPNVDKVQLDSAWVQRLEALLRFARIALGFVAIGVATVVLATVFNTVRMQALSQREEIAVARLVGATESFVRRPFLYQGALSGALAAVLSIVVAALALNPLNDALGALAQSYQTQFSLHLPPTQWLALAILATAVLGAISARWSVTRHSRF